MKKVLGGVADISKACGMSTGHIYHYFENKKALVEAIVEQSLSRDEVMLDQIKSLDDIIRKGSLPVSLFARRYFPVLA